MTGLEGAKAEEREEPSDLLVMPLSANGHVRRGKMNVRKRCFDLGWEWVGTSKSWC